MAMILVIDDSEAVRAQVKMALEGAGFEVAEAEDGDQGFEKLTNLKNISLVISDYNMPGMDGITMLTKAKEKLGKFSFPVFILTTETNENLKVAGKSIGVMAWIVKPFVQDKVIAAARKVIERAAAA